MQSENDELLEKFNAEVTKVKKSQGNLLQLVSKDKVEMSSQQLKDSSLVQEPPQKQPRIQIAPPAKESQMQIVPPAKKSQMQKNLSAQKQPPIQKDPSAENEPPVQKDTPVKESQTQKNLLTKEPLIQKDQPAKELQGVIEVRSRSNSFTENTEKPSGLIENSEKSAKKPSFSSKPTGPAGPSKPNTPTDLNTGFTHFNFQGKNGKFAELPDVNTLSNGFSNFDSAQPLPLNTENRKPKEFEENENHQNHQAESAPQYARARVFRDTQGNVLAPSEFAQPAPGQPYMRQIPKQQNTLPNEYTNQLYNQPQIRSTPQQNRPTGQAGNFPRQYENQPLQTPRDSLGFDSSPNGLPYYNKNIDPAFQMWQTCNLRLHWEAQNSQNIGRNVTQYLKANHALTDDYKKIQNLLNGDPNNIDLPLCQALIRAVGRAQTSANQKLMGFFQSLGANQNLYGEFNNIQAVSALMNQNQARNFQSRNVSTPNFPQNNVNFQVPSQSSAPNLHAFGHNNSLQFSTTDYNVGSNIKPATKLNEPQAFSNSSRQFYASPPVSSGTPRAKSTAPIISETPATASTVPAPTGPLPNAQVPVELTDASINTVASANITSTESLTVEAVSNYRKSLLSILQGTVRLGESRILEICKLYPDLMAQIKKAEIVENNQLSDTEKSSIAQHKATILKLADELKNLKTKNEGSNIYDMNKYLRC